MVNLFKKSLNYWNATPCNIKYSKKKFLSKEFFLEVNKKKFFVENHIKSFAEFSKYKNKKVLEIGCGIGTTAIEFIKNKTEYYGVDFSPKSLEIAKLAVKAFGLERFNPTFIEDDAMYLRKVKKMNIKFDLIYSFGVIHHTLNMQKCFDTIYDLANKNTEIKIMLYAKNSYKNLISDFRYEAKKNCPIVNLIDENKLNVLINKKFEIIDIKQDFIFPYILKFYKKNIYKKIKYFEVMPRKTFNKFRKSLGEHLLIKLKII